MYKILFLNDTLLTGASSQVSIDILTSVSSCSSDKLSKKSLRCLAFNVGSGNFTAKPSFNHVIPLLRQNPKILMVYDAEVV